MQLSQASMIPKVRIVVFASGWNPKQEYDNNLVKSFVKDGYSVGMVSYDQNTKTINPNMLFGLAYNYTIGENTYVKRKAKNLLNADEIQKVKKELNDNANQYEHTVYINGFGSEDHGKFHELYEDILIEDTNHTCLNWCTCCQAPQQYSEEPTRTPSNTAGFGDDTFYIKYDESSEKFKNYDILNKKFLDGEIPEEHREYCDKIIHNKKLNADFSPELVKEICGKVKQQEKQNISKFDMSNNSFVASENKHNIREVIKESKGWFHNAVGVPQNNPGNYSMNL